MAWKVFKAFALSSLLPLFFVGAMMAIDAMRYGRIAAFVALAYCVGMVIFAAVEFARMFRD